MCCNIEICMRHLKARRGRYEKENLICLVIIAFKQGLEKTEVFCMSLNQMVTRSNKGKRSNSLGRKLE